MNSEKIAEFNIKAAEYIGLDVHPDANNGVAMIAEPSDPDFSDFDFWPFDPYHDANDRNRVVEKMRIETMYAPISKKWWCSIDCDLLNSITASTDQYKSMDEAQIACIASVLGVNQ